jgi:multiple sugar transport system permease protein
MRWNNRTKYFLLLPAVVWVLVFTVFPLLYSIYLSLFKVRIGQTNEFIGLGNYARAFRDANAFESAKTTLFIVGLAVLIELALGLALAILYNRRLPFRGLLRAMVTLPIFVTPIAVALVFVTIFYEEGGLLNRFLPVKVPWLSDPNVAPLSIVLVDVWQWTPFVLLVLLAALQGIPEENYEAAKLETSSGWLMFRYITWPFIQPVLVIVLLLRLTEAFKVLDIPFTLTNGGPGVATQVFSLFTYRVGRQFFDFGYSAALAFLLLIVVMFIISFFFRRIRQIYQ